MSESKILKGVIGIVGPDYISNTKHSIDYINNNEVNYEQIMIFLNSRHCEEEYLQLINNPKIDIWSLSSVEEFKIISYIIESITEKYPDGRKLVVFDYTKTTDLIKYAKKDMDELFTLHTGGNIDLLFTTEELSDINNDSIFMNFLRSRDEKINITNAS